MSNPTFDVRGQVSPDGPRPDSSAAADAVAVREVPAAAVSSSAAGARAANPFASFEGERTVVAAISPIILRLARGLDVETKKYEAPPELLARARASALERALRRASRAAAPTHQGGARSPASEPASEPVSESALRLELDARRSGSWRRLRRCVMLGVEWMLALWR
jgi:hypothetical protein